VPSEPTDTITGAGAAVEFRSLDGLYLRGTLVTPNRQIVGATVLVHGGGATRDESGFFTRIAAGLAGVGVASLRFDLRGHGESDGRQEDLTICGVVNDIRAAVDYARERAQAQALALIGTSFAGGITAFFAARYPECVQSLVLLNPLLNYKKRFVDDKPYWSHDQIDDEAGRQLTAEGFLTHSPTFKLGRPLLNEVFYVQPHLALPDIAAPTLFVHGTRDTFIPVASSRDAVERMRCEARLVEIEGAQHGLAVHDDPAYRDPQTQLWQASVIDTITGWITSHGGPDLPTA
jgi:pimeloyl-ACP methyl ester carboxylesterase